MALLRARAVYGTDTARAAVDRIVAEVLASPRDGEAVAKDAAGMRDKMAAHKPPKGALDVKNGPGGLVALEFAMQVRSEERRVGNEGVGSCRSRWSSYH